MTLLLFFYETELINALPNCIKYMNTEHVVIIIHTNILLYGIFDNNDLIKRVFLLE